MYADGGIEPNSISFEEALAREPYFEKEVYFKYFGGGEFPGAIAIFGNSCKILLESLAGRLEAMRAHVESNNRDELRKSAHQLKGSFHLTGGEKPAMICQHIEANASQLPKEELLNLVSKIENISQQFRAELTSYLKEIGYTN